MTRSPSLACTIALCAPLYLVTGGLALIAVGETIGAAPFAGTVPQNSAEAAALGRAADLLRFLRDGQDPRRVYVIDGDIISSAVQRATTTEAAIWSRQPALIQLLDAQGAIGSEDERRALACLAADLNAVDIVEYLSPAGVAYCEPGKAYGQMLARTTWIPK